MNRYLFVTVIGAALVPSCAGKKDLTPCSTLDIRVWCKCEVAQSTVERAAAGLPVMCTIPFAATACVEGFQTGIMPGHMSGMSPGGSTELLVAIDKIRETFLGPNGPYVTVGDKAFWLRCPTHNDAGYANCITNNQPTNPWPGIPIADLNSANPLSPGLKPQGVGGSDTFGLGGGPVQGGDCSICLANAPCDGLTQDQCIQMHCAAVCPWDDSATMCQDMSAGLTVTNCSPPGGSCGNATDVGCCPGSYCIPSDVGAACM